MRLVNNGKMRLLRLKQFFEENTDYQHKATMSDILSYLDKYGIEAERKSILSDIDALEQFGMDVHRGTGNKTYYLGERNFELAELNLIINWIASSKFLSERKSKELIDKIWKLTSIHKREDMEQQIAVTGRVKSMNSSVLYYVNEIQYALSTCGYLDFKYYQYNMKKEREFKHNGKIYHVWPRYLIFDNNTYYLLANEGGKLKTFRVDRMSSVKRTEEPDKNEFNSEGQIDVDIIALLEDMILYDEKMDELSMHDDMIDIDSFMKSTFGMFHGKETTVKMIFYRDMMDTVIDKFGIDVKVDIIDDDHFRVTEKVKVSPQFFGWIFGLGDKVMIEYPLEVAKQMKDLLSERHKAYREKHGRNIYNCKKDDCK